jgi:hypothetical protein
MSDFYIVPGPNHDPITVTCSASGFETTSVTVNYFHKAGTAFVACPFSSEMTKEQRLAAEDCERQTLGKTFRYAGWSYPSYVTVHLPPAK